MNAGPYVLRQKRTDDAFHLKKQENVGPFELFWQHGLPLSAATLERGDRKNENAALGAALLFVCKPSDYIMSMPPMPPPPGIAGATWFFFGTSATIA